MHSTCFSFGDETKDPLLKRGSRILVCFTIYEKSIQTRTLNKFTLLLVLLLLLFWFPFTEKPFRTLEKIQEKSETKFKLSFCLFIFFCPRFFPFMLFCEEFLYYFAVVGFTTGIFYMIIWKIIFGLLDFN